MPPKVSERQLVIPGESVGVIHLKMTMAEVKAKLGEPKESKEQKDFIYWYYASKNWERVLAIKFKRTSEAGLGARVNSIEFNSPEFRLGTGNTVVHETSFYRNLPNWKESPAKFGRGTVLFEYRDRGLYVFADCDPNYSIAAIQDPGSGNIYSPDEKILERPVPPTDHPIPMVIDVGGGEGKFEISMSVVTKDKRRKLGSISAKKIGGTSKEIELADCEDPYQFSSGNGEFKCVADFIDTGDYNFDGYLDFSFLKDQSGSDANSTECYFLYDKKTKTFRYSADLSALVNADFDPKTKTISTHSTCGADCFEDETYKVINGVLQRAPVKSDQ